MRTARKFRRSRLRPIIENNSRSRRDHSESLPNVEVVVNWIPAHPMRSPAFAPQSCAALISANGRPVKHPAVRELLLSFREGLSCRSVLEDCLARIAAPEGEGARAFTRVYASAARDQADAAESFYRSRAKAGVLQGIPISVKDLFDVEGDVTTAGSRVLANAAPAVADAAIVSRLKRAGAVIVGRTNMTEFAYSGVGLNPHYGTPKNPYDRASALIPGGSSSGAAV